MATLEFKLQTPEAGKVDLNSITETISSGYEEVKKFVSEKIDWLKTEIKSSQTLADAQKFLESTPLYMDPASLTVTIGDKSIVAKDEAEYKSYVETVNLTLADANKELADSPELKKLEEEAQKVKTQTKTEMKTVETEVKSNVKLKEKTNSSSIEKRNELGISYEYNRETGISTFTIESWLAYAEVKGGDAAVSQMIDPERKLQSRDAKQLERRIDRHMNIKNEHRKAKKLEKDAKKAADLNEDLGRQRDAMANTTVDVMGASEKRKQVLYYDQVVKLALQEFKKNKYNADDTVYINTYNPLFVVEGVNPTGRVGIKMSPADVVAFGAEKSGDTPAWMNNPEYAKYFDAEDRKNAVENKGGAAALLTDALVKHTNFPPESAPALQSAVKIGSLIGLGILGWQTIKRVFNIGGKYKAGERWAWGLGAAGILVGIPAITGQSVTELLFSGDAKKAWKNTKDLLHLDGITDSIESLFSNTDNKVVYPAVGNLLFNDMTVEDYDRFAPIDQTTRKRKFKHTEYIKYKTEQLSTVTDPAQIDNIKSQIQLADAMNKSGQGDTIVDAHGKAINANTVDKKTLCGELYKNYLDAQLATGKILENNKNLKIADQRKLDDYLVEQTVKYGKKPSEIKVADLIAVGALAITTAPAAPATGNNNAGNNTGNNQPVNNNAANNTGNNAPAANPDKSKTLWESTKEEAKEKWHWLVTEVETASTNIKNYFKKLFDIKDDSKEVERLKGLVKAEKDKLKELKAQLNQLEKLQDTKGEVIVTSKEIGELKAIIEEQDQRISKIEAMLAGKYVDPYLYLVWNEKDKKFVNASNDYLPWLKVDQKLALNRAIKEVNFDLKFNTENDEMKFVAMKNKTLYLQSCGEKTRIRYQEGQYFIDESFMVGFANAEQAVRMANLTNFIKKNFSNRVTTNVEKPWTIANDGDLTLESQTTMDAFWKGDIYGMVFNTEVADGPDGWKSAIKRIGGTTFESHKQEYADYLNTIKLNGQSLWVRKESNGIIAEKLIPLGEKFNKSLNVVKSGNLVTPQKPDEYEASSSEWKNKIYDKNATIEISSGYLALSSHNNKINIKQTQENPALYKIGYVNGNEKDASKVDNLLSLDFATPEEALKVANLVNFLRKYYADLGTDNDAFNVSAAGDDLEFAEDGIMDWMDITPLSSENAGAYSDSLRGSGKLLTFAKWLNALKIWDKE